MSAPVRNDDQTPSMFPTMYAPPWAREGTRGAGDATMAAVGKALNASDELRRTLPPAPTLEDGKRWREKPFDGDIAAKHLRERRSLDPVPMPPMPTRKTPAALLARIAGAIGLAALAAFFVVGAMPQPLQGASQDAVVAKPFWSRLFDSTERVIVPAAEPLTFADRLAGVPVMAATEPAVPARAVQEPPVAPPSLRTLDREELAMLLKRSEALIAQGDIASARLMLTRAAEAGDARAALALGATYDGDVLRKLGVLGVAADAAEARAWYGKAAAYGLGEATRRLEQIAQSGG
jgi:hypothetical protein